jgi:hypothetical protein
MNMVKDIHQLGVSAASSNVVSVSHRVDNPVAVNK